MPALRRHRRRLCWATALSLRPDISEMSYQRALHARRAELDLRIHPHTLDRVGVGTDNSDLVELPFLVPSARLRCGILISSPPSTDQPAELGRLFGRTPHPCRFVFYTVRSAISC